MILLLTVVLLFLLLHIHNLTQRIPDADDEAPERLAVGRIVHATVESVNTGSKVVALRGISSTDLVPKRSANNASFRALKPGMLVEASVLSVMKNGIKVVFLRTFEATIHKLHLRDRELKRYEQGDVIKARIVFVDYANKDIGLSEAAHVLQWQQPAATKLQFGDFCYDSFVTEVQRKNGLFVRVRTARDKTSYPAATSVTVKPNAEELAAAKKEEKEDSAGAAPLGQIHISQLFDNRVKALKQGKFKKTQLVPKARVVGYRAMDNLVLLSTQPSVLEETVLSYEDIVVGGTVRSCSCCLRHTCFPHDHICVRCSWCWCWSLVLSPSLSLSQVLPSAPHLPPQPFPF